jgi:RNA 2',3'-cyclic 3'-phosphodiesterase
MERRGGKDRERPRRDTEGAAVRSFVAVLLPEAVRARVAEAAAELRERAESVAWVREENLHVTLRFLGSVDETTLGRVREALAEAAARLAPFRLALGGFGAFPSARAPRVLWVRLTAGAEPLVELHARLEVALARRGVPPEGREFHPHVTIGRVREPRDVAEVGELLGGTGAPLGESRVEAVHLMRSDLHPEGARYGVLAREALGGGAERSPGVDMVGEDP